MDGDIERHHPTRMISRSTSRSSGQNINNVGDENGSNLSISSSTTSGGNNNSSTNNNNNNNNNISSKRTGLGLPSSYSLIGKDASAAPKDEQYIALAKQLDAENRSRKYLEAEVNYYIYWCY